MLRSATIRRRLHGAANLGAFRLPLIENEPMVRRENDDKF